MHCQMIWSLWTFFILSLTKRCKGIDGPSGLKGKPECTSTTCEDANCAAIDDWNLFSQTCAILANHQKKTCSKLFLTLICRFKFIEIKLC